MANRKESAVQEEDIWKQAFLAIAIVVVLAIIAITAVQTMSFEQIGKIIVYVVVIGGGISMCLLLHFFEEID